MTPSRSLKYLIPVLVVVGCSRAYDYAGPAQPEGMRCAFEHGLAAGYELVEGDVDGDFMRLVQPIPRPPAEGLQPEIPAPRAVDLDRPVENQMLVTLEETRLSITVLGVTDAGVRVGPGSNADDQARTIIALCTSSPPLFPSRLTPLGRTEPDRL